MDCHSGDEQHSPCSQLHTFGSSCNAHGMSHSPAVMMMTAPAGSMRGPPGGHHWQGPGPGPPAAAGPCSGCQAWCRTPQASHLRQARRLLRSGFGTCPARCLLSHCVTVPTRGPAHFLGHSSVARGSWLAATWSCCGKCSANTPLGDVVHLGPFKQAVCHPHVASADSSCVPGSNMPHHQEDNKTLSGQDNHQGHSVS